jgi:hypothetical protein
MSFGNIEKTTITMLKKNWKINQDEQDKYAKIVSKDAPLHLPAGRHPCPRQQEDAGLTLGEPCKGVGRRSGFPAHLPATLLTSLYGASLN